MSRKLILVAALASMVSAPVNATRWVLIAKGSESIRYVDADEFLFEGATATIWLKTQYASKGKHGETLAIEKWLHDCEHGRSKLLAITTYKANGSVVSSAELPRYRLEWQAIDPSSVGAEIHERVCGIVNGPIEGRDPDKIDFETVS
jgi:hypothetical protein